MAVDAKICGLTRPGDAALAARLGASYLGVVFAESTRQVGPAMARDIVKAGGGVPVVGVFVSHAVDEILRLRDAAGLSAVQLHGAYDAAARMRLRREKLPGLGGAAHRRPRRPRATAGAGRRAPMSS